MTVIGNILWFLFGGLHAVHQQLQLRQLKGAACYIIAEHAAPLAFLNIHAEGAQRLDVIVNAFALCGDAVAPIVE